MFFTFAVPAAAGAVRSAEKGRNRRKERQRQAHKELRYRRRNTFQGRKVKPNKLPCFVFLYSRVFVQTLFENRNLLRRV